MPELSAAEWDAFQSLCGMTVHARGAMREPNEIRHRPIFIVPERGFTLLQLSAAFDAIFGAFDRLGRSQPALRDRYGRHVAGWMEREAERFHLPVRSSVDLRRTNSISIRTSI